MSAAVAALLRARGRPEETRGSRATASSANRGSSRPGLADQDPGERAGAVHVRVGHEPQFLELVGLQQVRLVDQHHGAVPFGGLGGEQVSGLGHQLGFEVAGLGAEGPDDLHVEAAVILSFRVSQGCDLRRPVLNSVADGTLTA